MQDNINLKIECTTNLVNEKKSTNDFIDIIMNYNQVFIYKSLRGFGSEIDLEV
jgi:hypothetical protein